MRFPSITAAFLFALTIWTNAFAQESAVQFTFNGPSEGSIPLRAQDVTVLDFTVTSPFNAEIRHLPFLVQTPYLTGANMFLDMKVWTVTPFDAVITAPVDVTGDPSYITYTNPNRVPAGARRFRVTVDVSEENDDGDSITVSLLPFAEGDVWNTDTDSPVPLSDIIPSSGLAGQPQTVTVSGQTPFLPPPPPQVWEETFNLAAGEWNFFFPVGIPDSPFEIPVYSWDATRQGYVQEYLGGGAVASVAANITVRVSTHERPTEELTLSPGWNLIGFTRFPTKSEASATHYATDILWVASRQGAHVTQVAVWSQIEDRYLRVGATSFPDGGQAYWYDGTPSAIQPGDSFFVYSTEEGLFNPNAVFTDSAKGAPSLDGLVPVKQGGEEGAITPPPFPTGISPRGKSLKTWGALKRQ